MRVKALYYATFRQITGRKEEEVELKNNARVSDLLSFLFKKYGREFRESIMDDGGLRMGVKILLNGRDVDFIDGFDTELRDGDVVHFFPAIAGGKVSRDQN